MYQNLFFLISVLLMVNVAPDVKMPLWPVSAQSAALISLFSYIGTLIAIRQRSKRDERWPLAPMLLVTFLFCHHFIWAGHRIYASALSWPRLLFPLLSLLLYFFGLCVYHWSRPYARRGFPKPVQFLIPFVVPFLAFELLFDALGLVPYTPLQNALHGSGDTWGETVVWLSLTTSFVLGMLFFLPPILVWAWSCRPLPASSLSGRLEALCKRLGFRYAGLRSWGVLSNGSTAAVVGAHPRFRYIMFTDRLLKEVPAEQIEAILVHEIGHSHHRHLIIYPFVVLGLVLCSSFLMLYIIDPLFTWYGLLELQSPSRLWNPLQTLTILIPFAALTLLYFRLVYGFFSRNFERQADLHIFAAQLDHRHLCDALYSVARGNDVDPKEPNWHHYSIHERADYLERSARQPSLIERHHRRVRRILAGYLLLLALGASWALGSHFGWPPIAARSESLRDALTEFVTASTRRQLAASYLVSEEAREIIADHYLSESAHYPGVVEFYASQDLSFQAQWEESLVLLIEAWRRFDFSGADPSVRDDFDRFSDGLLERLPEDVQFNELRLQLAKERARA